MIKFEFIARCGEQAIPLSVSLPYQPGKQGQRARRLAAGELIAALEAERAEVVADGEERVVVTVGSDTWVIAEGGTQGASRASF